MRVSDDTIKKMNEYFMALNYLSVGQLYLLDNPLLKRPLEPSDIKKKIIGHWGQLLGKILFICILIELLNSIILI